MSYKRNFVIDTNKGVRDTMIISHGEIQSGYIYDAMGLLNCGTNIQLIFLDFSLKLVIGESHTDS